MFCSNCGKELMAASKFCRYCGNKIEKELEIESHEEEALGIEEILEECVVEMGESLKQEPKAENKTVENREEDYRKLIGNNSDYYIRQFKKMERGERADFNCAVFLGGPTVLLYRSCIGYFKRTYGIYFMAFVWGILFTVIMMAYGKLNYSMLTGNGNEVIFVGSIIGVLVWRIFILITTGRNFNLEYFNQLKEVVEKNEELDGDMRCRYGINIGHAIVYLVIATLIMMSIPAITNEIIKMKMNESLTQSQSNVPTEEIVYDYDGTVMEIGDEVAIDLDDYGNDTAYGIIKEIRAVDSVTVEWQRVLSCDNYDNWALPYTQYCGPDLNEDITIYGLPYISKGFDPKQLFSVERMDEFPNEI